MTDLYLGECMQEYCIIKSMRQEPRQNRKGGYFSQEIPIFYLNPIYN